MRRPTHFRRLVAIAAAPLLVVSLAACGSDSADKASDAAKSSPSAPADEASESADAEESADPTEVADGDEVDKEDFLDLMKASMEGTTTAKMELTMTGSGTDLTASGVVDYQTTPPSMAMQMQMPALGAEQIDMRLVDGIMYMNLGQISGGKFFAIDLADKNSPLGDMSSLADSMDPTKSFDEFGDAFESATFIGEEDVDGESLSHYVVEVNTSEMESLKGQGAGALPKVVEYDLWFDGDGRTRQVEVDLGSSGSVQTRMFDWGQPVEIKAPPANQITQMPGLQGAA